MLLRLRCFRNIKPLDEPSSQQHNIQACISATDFSVGIRRWTLQHSLGQPLSAILFIARLGIEILIYYHLDACTSAILWEQPPETTTIVFCRLSLWISHRSPYTLKVHIEGHLAWSWWSVQRFWYSYTSALIIKEINGNRSKTREESRLWGIQARGPTYIV